MDLHTALLERRTISQFKPDVPDSEIINRAIEAARWAPNHRFTEPWHFYRLGPENAAQVVQLNTELVKAKKGEEAAAAKAAKWAAVPVWILVTSDRSEDALKDQEDYLATACAIQNLQLSLWADGVGCKWTTGDVTRTKELPELCWFDANCERVVGLLMIGYAAEVPPPVRNKDLPQISVDLP
jgi:nitroreductase